MLYDAAAPGDIMPAVVRPTRNRVREGVEAASVALWIEKASRDLQMMDILLGANPVLWVGVSFHAPREHSDMGIFGGANYEPADERSLAFARDDIPIERGSTVAPE